MEERNAEITINPDFLQMRLIVELSDDLHIT